MLKHNRLKELQKTLEKRGLSPDTRKAIRNAKIAIVDDRIEDLQSFIEGLRAEGFSNLVEKAEVSSVNNILNEEFDLIVLDLVGIAHQISEAYGVGVLAALKRADPALPILVVSGNTVTPDLSERLTLADAIRTKPILPAELAQEVEELLRARSDEHWGALSILSELRRLTPEVRDSLSWRERLMLWYHCHKLASAIEKADPRIIDRIVKVSSVVGKMGTAALRIVKITNALRP